MRNLWPLVELFVFGGLMLFCLAAWWFPPQKIYSLRQTLQTSEARRSSSVNLNAQDVVPINLPPEFRQFYGAATLKAYRLYLDPPPGVANALTFRLHEMLASHGMPTRQETGMFFYVVGLNLRQSQYGLRALSPAQGYQFSTNTPLTDEGKMLWYGRVAALPAVTPDTDAVLQMIRPGSKGFLCDVAFFYAPTLTLLKERS